MFERTENKALLYKNVLAVSVAVLVSLVSVFLFTGYDIRNMYALAGDIYYKQSIYHFLFSLSTVMTAFALWHIVFCGLEHTKPGRFITYCSENLKIIYIISWLLLIYTYMFLAFIEMAPISAAAVIPTGLLITATSIGLTAIWKRVRKRRHRGR